MFARPSSPCHASCPRQTQHHSPSRSCCYRCHCHQGLQLSWQPSLVLWCIWSSLLATHSQYCQRKVACVSCQRPIVSSLAAPQSHPPSHTFLLLLGGLQFVSQ